VWELPSPADVWRAVQLYLAAAYEAEPPAPVAQRLALLRAAPDAAFWECGAFERAERRYALRLGNRFYPHMKLVLEAAPGGRTVFRADTHDRHFVDLLGPPDGELAGLMARNEAIARAIEDAWEAQGLFTSREHLRDQMARWRAARAGGQ
jgi:hypothetical protein